MATIKGKDYVWLARQRYRYNSLTVKERAKLERIPGWYWIKDKQKQRTKDEWVVFAKSTYPSKIIPQMKELRDQGLIGLDACFRRYPEAFIGFTRFSRPVYPDYKTLLKKLTKDNKGVVPSFSWMKDNGHQGLADFLNRNKNLLVGVKRDKKPGSRRTDQEWDHIAREAIKANGGTFPTHKWMKHNGFGNLSVKIYQTPLLFSKYQVQDTVERFRRTIGPLVTSINEGVSLTRLQHSLASNIRQKYRDRKLSQDKIEMLEQDVPGWSWQMKVNKKK